MGCPGSEEDVIRPYSCLPYTWDNPSARSPRLAIDLPGGRRLGTFALGEVGRRTWVRPSAGRGDAESLSSPSTSSPPLPPPPSWVLPDNDVPAWNGTTAALEQRRAGRLLLVVVEADGPTRVLRVVDADRHPLPSLTLQASCAASADDRSRGLASHPPSSLLTHSAISTSKRPSAAVSPVVPQLTVFVELSSVGISIVSRREELAYMSIQARHSLRTLATS